MLPSRAQISTKLFQPTYQDFHYSIFQLEVVITNGGKLQKHFGITVSESKTT